jgi:ABC-2 type transport system permease protein
MTAAGHRQPQGPTLRPGPKLGPVFFAEYRLLLRSVGTKGRLIAIAALAGLSVLTAIATALGAPTDRLAEGVDFVNDNIATLIPVAVLVFGAAVLGDLIDDGSLVYLWLRPVPSWVHVLAAWAATVTIVVPLVLVPVVAATAIIDSSPALLGAAALGGLVAVAGYAGLFVTLGVRFKRALPWGLVYILIWEMFVASAGKTATKLALRSYVRSILATMTDTTIKLGEFSLIVGIAVPLLVGAAALAYASRRLARADVA